MEALFWLGLGALIGYAASQKQGFSPVGGLIGGALLGPIFAWLMFFMTGIVSSKEAKRKCPHCAEFIKQQARVCKHCGREVVGATATGGADFHIPPPPGAVKEGRRHPAIFALAVLLIVIGVVFGFAMLFNEAWHIVVLCFVAVVVGTLLLAKTQKAAVIALVIGVCVAGVAYFLPGMLEGREEVAQEEVATPSLPTADLPDGAVVVSQESQQEIQREFANAKARVEELREACLKVEEENKEMKELLVSSEARNDQIRQEMVKYRDGLNRAVAELNRLDAANKRLSSMVRNNSEVTDQ